MYYQRTTVFHCTGVINNDITAQNFFAHAFSGNNVMAIDETTVCTIT